MRSPLWLRVFCGLGIHFATSPTIAQVQTPAATAVPAATGTALAEFPFTLVSNHVVIAVKVGKDSASAASSRTLHFLLDTGASTTLLSQEAMTEYSVTLGKPVEENYSARVSGAGDSKGVNATQFVNEVITVGRYEINGTVVVVPMGPDVRRFSIDGAIGDDFFGSLVVEIDYARKVVRLYLPDSFHPPAASEHFNAVPLLFKDNGIPYIAASVTPFGYGPTAARMVLDTGDSGALTLYGTFVAGQKWKEALPQLIPQIEAGLGSRGHSFIARLNTSDFGGVTLQQPTVSFSSAREGALAMTDADGQFGGDVFKHFTLIFDFPHKVMYVCPVDSALRPFPRKRYFGMRYLPPVNASGGYKIEIVDANSPASVAGVRAGDCLYKVDGENVASYTYDALSDKLNAIGDERTVEVGPENGPRRTVKIKPLTY